MIRLAQPDDVPYLKELSNKAFGEKFHNDTYFSEQNLKECTIYDNGKIAGYCMVFVEKDRIKIDSVVVDEEERGKGVATALIEDVIMNFPSRTIYTNAWKRGNQVPIAPILDRLGFHKLEEVTQLWYKRSLESEFECVECGNPCHCRAIVYQK